MESYSGREKFKRFLPISNYAKGSELAKLPDDLDLQMISDANSNDDITFGDLQ